ncbi:MAG: N-methyl-L-tryptophan oxidase [Sinomonas sp.]|nr:N-methyl-L-tryptophan oxidase [Sinomonas sp.]
MGYTHIVIGAGAIGAAAAYWLSRRPGTRVLVIEQFDLVNTLNSSGDVSRIIRHAYHSTAYTKLTPAMFEAWAEVEERSGLQLYVKTGGLDLATSAESSVGELDAYRDALAAEGIPYEDLTAAEIRSRYPQWHIEDDVTGMYQEAGGLIDIRKSVAAHTSLALANGAEFLPHTTVSGVVVRPDSVTVRTARGDFDAGGLVIAAGSWLGELMPDLGLDYRLTLSQEQVSYFTSQNLHDFTPEKFPIWIFHGETAFYGFPVYGEPAVKLARDMRGRFIESGEWVVEGDDGVAAIRRGFRERYLPGAVGPVYAHRTCVYDMAPDREFVLDTVPGSPHVAVFNGAGHAGKFASLVGKILAELITDGATAHPIEPFSLRRPATAGPGFEPAFRVG